MFSLMEIALKFVSGDFNPVQMTFSRFLIGGLVLLPLSIMHIKKENIHLDARLIKKLILLGFVGIFLSMILYQLAIANANASVLAVLFSSNPAFVMVFAYLLLGEPIYKNNILSVIMDVAGIMFIINPFNTKLSVVGIVLILVSTLLFALYGVLGKRECEKVGGLTVTCFSFIFGAIELMAFALITHITPVADFFTAQNLQIFANIPFFSGYSAQNILIVLFVYIGVTGIGYASYFKAMEVTSANEASLVFFFKPALAPLLALVILHEIIPVNMIIGIIFILAGSMCSILPKLLNIKKDEIEELEMEIDSTFKEKAFETEND